MRCCLLSTNLESGGAERQIVQLARHWPTDEVPLEIVLLERRGAWLDEIPDAVPVHALFERLPQRVGAQMLRLPSAVRRLRRAVEGGGYDVIVPFLWLPAVLAARVLRSQGSERPSLAYSVQSDLARDFRLHADGFVRRQVACLTLPRAVDVYFPLSEGVAQRTADLLRVPMERFEVIPNSTEIDRITALAERDPVPALNRGMRLVSVGRLHPAKGTEDLLLALARLREAGERFKCLVLGEGALRPFLEQRIRRLALGDCVQLLGHAANPYAYVRSADVFVSASRWETFGIAILEAMALGRPVVATRTDGAVDLIEDGATGLVVPVGDTDAMTQALQSLSRDPALRARLGAAASDRARAYDARVVTERFVNAVRNVAGRQGVR